MEESLEKNIYLVRHGQSEANILPVFQTPDSPLNQLGTKQAKLIAERVSKIPFELLLVSPWPRAKDTAKEITTLTGKRPEYSDLFVERIKPTDLNGKSHDDPEADNLWQQWKESLFATGLRVKDGENFDDLMKRADKALSFLKNRPEKTIMVVTHGFFLRTLIARAVLGKALSPEVYENFQNGTMTENTGISALRYSATHERTSWRLWVYNDSSHLG